MTLGGSPEDWQQWWQCARHAISIPIAAQSSATLCRNVSRAPHRQSAARRCFSRLILRPVLYVLHVNKKNGDVIAVQMRLQRFDGLLGQVSEEI
jgi:hypothetical protein